MKKTKTRKKNPQDLTLRNLRALNKKITNINGKLDKVLRWFSIF